MAEETEVLDWLEEVDALGFSLLKEPVQVLEQAKQKHRAQMKLFHACYVMAWQRTA